MIFAPPMLLLGLMAAAPPNVYTFSFPVEGRDTFSFERGYPVMSAQGDYVEGVLSTPNIPGVNRVNIHLALAQTDQACDGEFSYTLDGRHLASGPLPMGKDVLYIVTTDPLEVSYLNIVETTEHTLRVTLNTDLWSCGAMSRVEFIEEESWVELSLVQEDLDGDGAFSLVTLGDDCDDGDSAIYPGAEEVCGDDVDQDCDGADLQCPCEEVDADEDGYSGGEGCPDFDCDDEDPAIHPGADELCGDAVDQDCDGADRGCTCEETDADGDGYGLGGSCAELDCDDGDPAVHPGAEEVDGNQADDDCDGAVDEGQATPTEDGGTPTGGGGEEPVPCGCDSRSSGGGLTAALAAALIPALRRRRSRHTEVSG